MRLVPDIAVLTALALVAGSAGAAAAKDDFPGVIGADDRRIVDSWAAPWNAIGRVNVAGYRRRGSCTGTLIASDQVVTAAHCLFDRRSGQPVPLGNIHFVAGQRRDRFLAHAKARCVRLANGHRFSKQPSMAAFRSDVAIIVLTQNLAIAPVPLAAATAPEVGTALVHPSYGRDRPYLLSADSNCRVQGKSEGVLLTDCDTNFGGSGGPVLVRENGAFRLLAVMVGVANGRYSAAVEAVHWRALSNAPGCP